MSGRTEKKADILDPFKPSQHRRRRPHPPPFMCPDPHRTAHTSQASATTFYPPRPAAATAPPHPPSQSSPPAHPSANTSSKVDDDYDDDDDENLSSSALGRRKHALVERDLARLRAARRPPSSPSASASAASDFDFDTACQNLRAQIRKWHFSKIEDIKAAALASRKMEVEKKMSAAAAAAAVTPQPRSQVRKPEPEDDMEESLGPFELDVVDTGLGSDVEGDWEVDEDDDDGRVEDEVEFEVVGSGEVEDLEEGEAGVEVELGKSSGVRLPASSAESGADDRASELDGEYVMI